MFCHDIRVYAFVLHHILLCLDNIAHSYNFCWICAYPVVVFWMCAYFDHPLHCHIIGLQNPVLRFWVSWAMAMRCSRYRCPLSLNMIILQSIAISIGTVGYHCNLQSIKPSYFFWFKQKIVIGIWGYRLGNALCLHYDAGYVETDRCLFELKRLLQLNCQVNHRTRANPFQRHLGHYYHFWEWASGSKTNLKLLLLVIL